VVHGASSGRGEISLARSPPHIHQRLFENPNNSEETVRALAGHVSRKMMEHYSHIRQKAKEAAIAGLDNRDPSENFARVGTKLGTVEAPS
jgi:hypothetical protein